MVMFDDANSNKLPEGMIWTIHVGDVGFPVSIVFIQILWYSNFVIYKIEKSFSFGVLVRQVKICFWYCKFIEN